MVGAGIAVYPVTLSLHAQGSRWTNPNDRTSLRRFKAFPSLAGLSIARFDQSIQTCQPTSVSAHWVCALSSQSGGLRGRINAEMSTYLSTKVPNSGALIIFWLFYPEAIRTFSASGLRGMSPSAARGILQLTTWEKILGMKKLLLFKSK
jgi:hypothetical protein